MRFALRCIIYLGAVYVAILRHDGYLVDPDRLAAVALAAPQLAGEQIAAQAAPQIARRVEAYCRNDIAACLADGGRLARPLAGSAAAPAIRSRRGVSSVGTP